MKHIIYEINMKEFKRELLERIISLNIFKGFEVKLGDSIITNSQNSNRPFGQKPHFKYTLDLILEDSEGKERYPLFNVKDHDIFKEFTPVETSDNLIKELLKVATKVSNIYSSPLNSNFYTY